MIVGETFVWLHLGKTGGKTMRSAIELIEDETLEKIYRMPDHHFSVEEYEKKYQKVISDKKIIIGFRRMPSWMQSYNIQSHKAYSAEFSSLAKDGLMISRSGVTFKPDDEIKRYFKTKKSLNDAEFIRIENIFEDFSSVFSNNLFCKEKLLDVCKIKKGSREYEKEVFSHEDLVRMYENNPIWRDLERRLYGSALCD